MGNNNGISLILIAAVIVISLFLVGGCSLKCGSSKDNYNTLDVAKKCTAPCPKECPGNCFCYGYDPSHTMCRSLDVPPKTRCYTPEVCLRKTIGATTLSECLNRCSECTPVCQDDCIKYCQNEKFLN